MQRGIYLPMDRRSRRKSSQQRLNRQAETLQMPRYPASSLTSLNDNGSFYGKMCPYVGHSASAAKIKVLERMTFVWSKSPFFALSLRDAEAASFRKTTCYSHGWLNQG